MEDLWSKTFAHIQFTDKGLVPVIAQQYDSGRVLMMAWMNNHSLEKTLQTKKMHYWSRSRSCLWRKGETSGNEQRLIELRLDCDGDALLALVDQEGKACHKGHYSCFFNVFRKGKIVETPVPIVFSDKQ